MASINLVSLMDIFTILVFFLLVNSSDVEVLPGKASIKLPESISDVKPNQTLVIEVNQKTITVQGREIANVASVINEKDPVIAGLQQELEYQTRKLPAELIAQAGYTGSVTILGDREIPYKLLKKIMVTCAQANFGNIALAVQQKNG